MEERDLVWAMLGVGIAAVMLVAGLLLLVTREEPIGPPQPVPTVTSFIYDYRG